MVIAPRDVGIVATRVPKKVLQFAGIEDVFTSSRGLSKTLGNFVKAVMTLKEYPQTTMLNGYIEAAWYCTTQRTIEPPSLVTSNHFQIFIKTPLGKSSLIWVVAIDCVMNLKNIIAKQIGYPVGLQHLLYGAGTLWDLRSILDSKIML